MYVAHIWLQIVHHWNHGEGRKHWARKRKAKKTVFITYAASSILYLHVIGYLSGSMIPVWAGYHPVACTEVDGWLSIFYLRVLLRDLTYKSLERMERSILDVQYTSSPQMPVSIGWFVIGAQPSLVGWLPWTTQPNGGCRVFAFILELRREHFHHEKAACRTSPV